MSNDLQIALEAGARFRCTYLGDQALLFASGSERMFECRSHLITVVLSEPALTAVRRQWPGRFQVTSQQVQQISMFSGSEPDSPATVPGEE